MLLIIFPWKERKTKWVKKIAMSVSLSDMYKTVMIFEHLMCIYTLTSRAIVTTYSSHSENVKEET